jgi:ankyrin repeat protein/beta-lactamase regulating signal transducer with metallopeptidase domain
MRLPVLAVEPWMQQLGWVLIHFVWQGAAIALLLAVVLRLLAGRSSRSRYAVCGMALLLCCVAPIVTWVALNPSPTSDAQAASPIQTISAPAVEAPLHNRPGLRSSSNTVAESSVVEHWQDRLLQQVDAVAPDLVALWLLGVLVLTIRLAWAWMLTSRLCRLGTPIRDAVVLQRWNDLLDRMAIRLPVCLLESAGVDVPTLIGWVRPTILLPASVLTGLTPDQLEAVLVHELAHVRRFDYLFNLLQSILETILFYHPAVWWIGRRLREERENCCDDISLEVVRNRHVYASALALLEEGRQTPLTLTASGGSLLRRIRRIAGVDGRRVSAAPLVVGLLFLIALVVGSAWETSLRAAVASSTAQSGHAKRNDQLYGDDSKNGAMADASNRISFPAFKVTDMPVPDFIAKVTALYLERDPNKVGIQIKLDLPPGEPPARVTLDLADGMPLFGILNKLCEQCSLKLHLKDGVIQLRQLARGEVAFNTKTEGTKIDVNFDHADVFTALKTIHSAAEAKGFAFTLEGADALKASLPAGRSSPVTFKADAISVDQALRSVSYLGDCKVIPLPTWTGYHVAKMGMMAGPAAWSDVTNLRRKVVKNGDGGVVFKDEELGNGLTLYPFVKVQDNLRGIRGAMVMFIDGEEPPNDKPRLIFDYVCKLLDKTHVEVDGTFKLKDLQGTTISTVAGHWAQPVNTRVRLLVHGQPTILVPPPPHVPPVGMEVNVGYYVYVKVGLLEVPGGKPLTPAMGGGQYQDVEFADVSETPAKPKTGISDRTPTQTSITAVAYDKTQSAPPQAKKNDAATHGMMDAIKAGNAAKVTELLQQGADANATDGSGESALQAALQGDHVEIAKALLEKGSDPNASSAEGNPFVFARSAGAVRLLVQHGANLRPKLEDDATLIERVASNGSGDNPAVIDELIKEGAPFDPKSDGVSALARAAARNQVPTMKMLVDHGVDPNAYATDPRMLTTPLRNAVGEPSSDAVKFLLERGANPSGSPRDQITPLAMAIQQGRPENEALLRKAGAHDVSDLAAAAAYGQVDKVSELLEKGANVDAGDNMGETPLCYAIRRGQVETARVLVAHGANINKFDSRGLSPWGELLFMADFFKENPELEQYNWNVSPQEAQVRLAALQQLFAKDSVGPDYRDGKGRTVLHLMAMAGNTMVMFFADNKEHPADPNIQDNDGNTPLLLAALSPHAKDLAIKRSTYENYKTPQQKMKYWNAEAFIADNLIKARAKLDLVIRDGKTVGELAMEAAVKANNPQLVSVLQAAGAKLSQPGVRPGSNPGATGGANSGSDSDLLEATKRGDAVEVDRLLQHGANPNVCNDDETPLMYARDVKTVRLLVEHGANLRPKLNNGLTLLAMIVGRDTEDNSEIIVELIKDGSEFDPHGNGPGLLVEASRYNQINIVRQMLDLGVSPDAYADDHFLHQSALVAATQSTKPDILKLLLARGAHFAAARGFTSPLGAAIDTGRWENAAVLRQAGEADVGMLSEFSARGNVQKAGELIQAGANVNETDKGGETPLLFAVRRGNPDIARFLLQHGANINLFSNKGETPYGAFLDLTEREYGGNTMPAWGISSDETSRRIAEFKALFKQYPRDPNYRDASGQTALNCLAFEGNVMQVACLLEQKPDVNLRDGQGSTPLLRAATSPIAHELDISQIDYEKDGKTISTQWNAEARIADELIKAGAKIDLVVRNGKTVGELAMEAAVKADNAQLISVLQAGGAKMPAGDPPVPAVLRKGDSVRASPVQEPGVTSADASAPKAIEVKPSLAEINDDDYQANRDKIDAAMKAGGSSLLNTLKNMSRVDMISDPSVSCQSSKTAHIDTVRESATRRSSIRTRRARSRPRISRPQAWESDRRSRLRKKTARSSSIVLSR